MGVPPGPRCQRCGQAHPLYADCLAVTTPEERAAQQRADNAEAIAQRVYEAGRHKG